MSKPTLRSGIRLDFWYKAPRMSPNFPTLVAAIEDAAKADPARGFRFVPEDGIPGFDSKAASEASFSYTALERESASKRTVRPLVDEFTQKDGRKLYVLGEGRLINLAAAEGHPASVMDMSFANQALSVEHLVKDASRLERKVYRVPVAIDHAIAQLKLASMGVSIDTLTTAQEAYLSSWTQGT